MDRVIDRKNGISLHELTLWNESVVIDRSYAVSTVATPEVRIFNRFEQAHACFEKMASTMH